MSAYAQAHAVITQDALARKLADLAQEVGDLQRELQGNGFVQMPRVRIAVADAVEMGALAQGLYHLTAVVNEGGAR